MMMIGRLIPLVAMAFATRPVYLSPSAIVAGPDGASLYVAEHTANQVAVFDIAAGAVKRVYTFPDPPGGLGLSPDGSKMYVSGAVSAGKVYVVDLPSGEVVKEIPVGHTPVSPLVSPDGAVLYVCNRFSNTVSVVDLAAGREVALIQVLREPVDAALTPDGKWLLVSNHLPVGPANADYVAARVSIIDTASRKLAKNLSMPNGSTSIQGICVSPDGRYAYAAHLQAHFQLVTIQLDRGWMNTNVVSVIDVAQQRLLGTVVLDEKELGAANPWDVACTGDGRYLVVAHAGTHELSVIDRAALHARLEGRPAAAVEPERRSTFRTALVPPDFRLLSGIRRRVKLAGKGPRALATVGTTVYAAEYFSDSLGVVKADPEVQREARSLPLGPKPTMTLERVGELLFHDASQSYQHWQSCSTCHTSEARPDGLNWDLLNDGIGNPKNAKSLLLSHQTPPAMITGVRDSAETAVRAGFRFILFVERPESDAQAVDAYLKSLKPVPSPYLVNGELSAAAKRGQELFHKAGCASCHPLPLGTNLKKADVGTGADKDAKREFDTPTLIEVWRTAPYLYDGRAATIQDVLNTFNRNDAHGATSGLSEQEINDLAEYVLSL